MLLVDADETEIFHGCEECRARADDDLEFTRAESFPHGESRLFAKSAMQDGNLVTEARAKAVHELRRECNFWDEQDGALSAGEGMSRRVQVDFRLSRCRNSVEQEGASTPRIDGLIDRVDRSALVFVQDRRSVA